MVNLAVDFVNTGESIKKSSTLFGNSLDVMLYIAFSHTG